MIVGSQNRSSSLVVDNRSNPIARGSGPNNFLHNSNLSNNSDLSGSNMGSCNFVFYKDATLKNAEAKVIMDAIKNQRNYILPARSKIFSALGLQNSRFGQSNSLSRSDHSQN